MRLVGTLCLLLASLPVAAFAADDTHVPKDQARLVLDMPNLTEAREFFHSLGWNAQFTRRVFYAAQIGKTGSYPRAQVYFDEVGPQMVYTAQFDLDEKFIRAQAPFFKDRGITMLSQASGGGSATTRISRFAVDEPDCIAFVTFIGGFGRSGDTVSTGAVHGIYCGAAKYRLTDADIQAAVSGWTVLNPDRTVLAKGVSATVLPPR